MTRYKLFRLVAILSKAERAGAEKYLSLSWASTNGDCFKLFRHVKSLTPEQEIAPDVKQVLFQKQFPAQAFDDAKLRKLMTRLTHLLEDFLIEQELTRQPSIRQELLVRSLGSRSDYRLFKETIELRLATLDGQPERGLAFFEEKNRLLNALYFHPETKKFTREHDYFQQALVHRAWHFTLTALLDEAECLSINRTIRANDSSGFFDAALVLVNRAGSDAPESVRFFREIIDLVRSPDPATDLTTIKNSLLKVFDRLGEHERQMALKLLIFYATPFSNTGSKQHSRFIFDLFRLGIDSGLIRPGNLDTLLFVNIAITGSVVGELEWTAQFIRQHCPRLPEEDQSNAFHLCQGVWHYHAGLEKNDPGFLKEALLQLSLVPVRSEEMFDLRVRSLQLRILFDTYLWGEATLEHVLSQAKNFERYLKLNTTYSEAKRAAYFQFIHHFRRLARLADKTSFHPKSVSDFLAALRADEACVLRHWLEEKGGSVGKKRVGE